MNKWSKKYDCCQSCGTTETPHHGKGLCRKCYREKFHKTPEYREKDRQRRRRPEIREKRRLYAMEYYNKNRERMKELARKANSRRRATSGEDWYRRPPEYWENRHRLIYEEGHRCAACGSDKNLEAHHIIPECKGGTHDIANLIILCEEHHRGRYGVHGAAPDSEVLPIIADLRNVVKLSDTIADGA